MAKDVNIDSRKTKAVEMLCRGMTQTEIAKELGISRRTLVRWMQEPEFRNLTSTVAHQLNETTVNAAKQHLNDSAAPIVTYQQKKRFIAEQCEQLDKALQAIMPLVQTGDLQSIDRLIKLCDRKSRLLGLDQKVVDIGVAIATLSQIGILKEHETSSAFEILDEAQAKLSQLGAD